jgi:hypothetical protein
MKENLLKMISAEEELCNSVMENVFKASSEEM